MRYRAPGRLTSYSSYGILLAGILIEDVTGQSYSNYVRENILEPGGLHDSRIMSVKGGEEGVATPYLVEDGRARPVPYEWYISAPASSMVATARDMGRFASIFLGDGTRNGSILSQRLKAAMFSQQATVHPDVPRMGTGVPA